MAHPYRRQEYRPVEPLISLVQADGRGDLERKANSGDAGDPFRARHNNAFNKTTVPAAAYYDRSLSNIDISEISDSGASMTFKVGALSAENPLSPTPAAAVPINRPSYDIKASPTGNVVFTLPAAGYVSVRAYDVRGKQVAVLVDGMRNVGTHNVRVGMGQGLYIIRMKSGEYYKEVKIRRFK